MGLKNVASVLGLVALVAVPGCGDEEPPAPLEVRVLAARTRVEVSTRRAGDCTALGELSGRAGCRSLSWRVLPTESCVASSCVREMRLEAGGKVLARSELGRSAVFDLGVAYPEGTTLVIEGCDAPIRLALPAAKSDAEIALTPSVESVTVAVSGPASGTFATAGSYTFSQGYVAACETEGLSATLPVSDDYSFWRVSVHAFDEPVRVTTDVVRAELFPSVHTARAVSTQLDLGPTWDAAVALARESSLYEGCEAACAAFSGACDEPAGDTSTCAVPCVAAGEAFPACLDEHRARVDCAAASASCNTTAAPDCAESDAAWQACAS